MPQPFKIHVGVAAPLLINNIDTDQIIPSREMKTVSKEGLGKGLFAGWRYVSAEDKRPNEDFVLNMPEYAGASILLGGANFGCGSSREHAVWALAEYGVRAVIAPSFGEIFFGNCARNGVLAVVLDVAEVEQIAAYVSEDPQRNTVEIDLEAQKVSLANGSTFTFNVNPYHKRLLLEGADPIALTMSFGAKIDQYLAADQQHRPWLY